MKLVDFILKVIDILHYMEIASIFLFALTAFNHTLHDNIFLIISLVLCLLSSILILIAMLIYYYITDKNDKKLT